MRLHLTIVFISLIAPCSISKPPAEETIWLTSFEEAKTKATNDNKAILIVFSGSDWCKSCIRLERSVLSNPGFHEYANESLVLLKVDFPRKKTNRLSEDQQTSNEKLAEKYNQQGKFPHLVLLDKSGQVTATIEQPSLDVDQFIRVLNKYLDES
jgi:thioredoxin-related protein